MADNSDWLALMVGNSRLHWAWFAGETLCCAWDTEYLPADVQLAKCRTLADLPAEIFSPCQINLKSQISRLKKLLLPLYLASVVPGQTSLWQSYPKVHLITLDQVPLKSVYMTLGIDRALAVWGAGVTWGFPVLVIDAGTALTFTGANSDRCLVGGAILPGVRLQLQSLAQKTASLPLVDTPEFLPPRWALDTSAAIQSGVSYTIVAGLENFITAWWQDFPDSCIALTGGDRSLLLKYLQSLFPDTAAQVTCAQDLIFRGMQAIRNSEFRI